VFLTLVLACAWNLAAERTVSAAAPRVLPEGQVPNDRRLEPPKDLNGYFPFHVPESKEAWQRRAESLRRRILVATGLWPMPEKTPLDAVIHGRVDREEFTVDKVSFESYPGHHVTGLLYRPRAKSGRLPAVLCPHGHGGRLQDYGEKKIRQLIVQGAERFEGSGRYPKMARCAQLARMGCVVFIYDMVGYADSVQISREVAHRFAKQRPEMDTKDSWGFFGVQAELRLQSIMGLQTYNSIRALDFLSQLPDVDPQRLGVTGGSGGGTQTILLCAIDPRPVVAFPQGMVSTAMQGGCTCENCSLLRIGTGNVELAALFAPKPQGMTAANDWTKDMPTKGFPELKQLYALLDAKDRVICESQLHFPHNYNYVTRAIMYRWFNRYLKLGLEEPIVEEDFPPLTSEEWTVWDESHPRPEGGPDYERSLTKWMDEESNRQIAALAPSDAKSLARYREIVGAAVDTIIGRPLPEAGAVEREKVEKNDRGDYIEFKDLLHNTKHGEELPVVSFYPKTKLWNKRVVIWVDGQGKAALFDAQGAPRPEVRKLLDAGTSVVGADLVYQGEFLADGQPLTEARVVDNPREFAGYTFGYNHPLFAQRVHDVLTLVSFIRNSEYHPERVDLVGTAGAGPWVAAACAQARGAVDRVAIDTGGFRFVDLESYRDVNFLPGAVKYGDLPGLLALSAPHKLWLAGEEGQVPAIVSAAYRAAGRADAVRSHAGEARDVPRAAVQWLLSE
jgi:dienelactone hydrolase